MGFNQVTTLEVSNKNATPIPKYESESAELNSIEIPNPMQWVTER